MLVNKKYKLAHSGFIAGSIETSEPLSLIQRRKRVLIPALLPAQLKLPGPLWLLGEFPSSFRLYCRLNWNWAVSCSASVRFVLIPALLPAQLKRVEYLTSISLPHLAHSGFIAGSIETIERPCNTGPYLAHSGFIAGSIETCAGQGLLLADYRSFRLYCRLNWNVKISIRDSVYSSSSFRLYCRLNWNTSSHTDESSLILLIPALLPAQLKQKRRV